MYAPDATQTDLDSLCVVTGYGLMPNFPTHELLYAWCAGFLDGDGHISISLNMPANAVRTRCRNFAETFCPQWPVFVRFEPFSFFAS